MICLLPPPQQQKKAYTLDLLIPNSAFLILLVSLVRFFRMKRMSHIGITCMNQGKKIQDQQHSQHRSQPQRTEQEETSQIARTLLSSVCDESLCVADPTTLPHLCRSPGELLLSFSGAIHYELHIFPARARESADMMLAVQPIACHLWLVSVPRTIHCGSGNR